MLPGNQALDVNPFIVNGKSVDIHITARGSDWYWAVTSVMGTTMLAVIGLSFLKPKADRIFHYLLASAALVAMVEHYSMASNLGWVPIDVEWMRPAGSALAGATRQIWWVRYCAWLLTWPLLALASLLAAAMPFVMIAWTCFLSSAMAVMALVGALVSTKYKWGYYGFWVGCWVAIGYYLVWSPRRFARALGYDVARAHLASAGWIWLLWMCYPVCWGISEGANVIHPDSEFIFYGVLDCCLIPIFSAAVLFLHRDIAAGRLGVAMRDHDSLFRAQQAAVANGKQNGFWAASGKEGKLSEANALGDDA